MQKRRRLAGWNCVAKKICCRYLTDLTPQIIVSLPPGKCVACATRSTWDCFALLACQLWTGSWPCPGRTWSPLSSPSPSSAPHSPSPTSSTSPASTGCSSRASTFSYRCKLHHIGDHEFKFVSAGPVPSLFDLDQVQTFPLLWPGRTNCQHPRLVCPQSSRPVCQFTRRLKRYSSVFWRTQRALRPQWHFTLLKVGRHGEATCLPVCRGQADGCVGDAGSPQNCHFFTLTPHLGVSQVPMLIILVFNTLFLIWVILVRLNFQSWSVLTLNFPHQDLLWQFLWNH